MHYFVRFKGAPSYTLTSLADTSLHGFVRLHVLESFKNWCRHTLRIRPLFYSVLRPLDNRVLGEHALIKELPHPVDALCRPNPSTTTNRPSSTAQDTLPFAKSLLSLEARQNAAGSRRQTPHPTSQQPPKTPSQHGRPHPLPLQHLLRPVARRRRRRDPGPRNPGPAPRLPGLHRAPTLRLDSGAAPHARRRLPGLRRPPRPARHARVGVSRAGVYDQVW